VIDDGAFGFGLVRPSRNRGGVGRALAAIATTGEGGSRETLISRGDEALEAATGLSRRIGAVRKTRIHGDLRLSRLLIAEGDIFITGFRGASSTPDPAAALGAPAQDVARLLADIDEAALTVLGRLWSKGLDSAETAAAAWTWRDATRAALLHGYAEGLGTTETHAGPLCALFRLEAAFTRLRAAAEGGRAVETPARLALEALDAAAAAAERAPV
jgi:hypothetical protein